MFFRVGTEAIVHMQGTYSHGERPVGRAQSSSNQKIIFVGHGNKLAFITRRDGISGEKENDSNFFFLSVRNKQKP